MQDSYSHTNHEITLLDLWHTLVRRKWLVLGVSILSAVVAAVTVTLMQPQWEATATIQIGAVGQPGQIIEPPAVAVARMKLKSFEDAVLANLVPTGQKTPEARLYRRSLKVRVISDTNLIELKVRGYSPASALRSADRTIDYLRKVHQKMSTPAVLRITQLLAQTKREIDQIKAEREKVVNVAGVKDGAVAQTGFMENIILANIMIQRNTELRALELAKIGYEEQLDPMSTYPTGHLEKISVSEEPVAPQKDVVILLAAVLGLLLGVMAAFWRPPRVCRRVESSLSNTHAVEHQP